MAFDAPLPKPLDLPKLKYEEMVEALKTMPFSLTPVQPQQTYVLGCTCPDCAKARMRMWPEPRPKPMYPPEAIALLKKARARIDRGWVQKKTSYQGNVCAMGGIMSAIQDREEPMGWTSAEEAKMERLVQCLPGMNTTADVIHFNDAAGRTKAEVLALFDAGIARLEGRPVPAPSYQPLSFWDFKL